MKALATNKDWDGLEAFAKSKKSPIGYEPFVVSATLAQPVHTFCGRKADIADTFTFPFATTTDPSGFFRTPL